MELWASWSGGRCPGPWQGGWNEISFKVPSNPNCSMILCNQMVRLFGIQITARTLFQTAYYFQLCFQIIPIVVGESRLASVNSRRSDLIKDECFRRSLGSHRTPVICVVALWSWNIQTGSTEVAKFLIFSSLVSIQPLGDFFGGKKSLQYNISHYA